MECLIALMSFPAFGIAMSSLTRLGMKLFKIDAPEDVYGFEDVDYV